MRAFNLKHPLFRVILLQICLAILLSSCGGDTACVLQAVQEGRNTARSLRREINELGVLPDPNLIKRKPAFCHWAAVHPWTVSMMMRAFVFFDTLWGIAE